MEYISGLVSVIIPTYHRCDLLKRAVDSVLGQTYDQIECIVVNDNTPGDDYSVELYKLIEQFRCNEKFIFLEQEKHINGAEARNCGIRNAKGEYIAFLDDDDWWEPDKTEKQLAFFAKQNEECGAVSTLVNFCNNGKIIRKSLPYNDGFISKQILMRDIDVTTCCILVKHKCLDETGYFDTSLKRHQEIQLFSFLSDRYMIKLLPEYLTDVSVDTGENNPSSDIIRKIKSDFFLSVEPLLKKYSKRDRNLILGLHKFEIAFVEFKEKKLGAFSRDVLVIFKSPRIFYYAMKRVIRRKKEYRLCR